MSEKVVSIAVVKGDVNKAVLIGLRQSMLRRMKGEPITVRIIQANDKGKTYPILTILPQGDIEELIVPPMRVGMLDRVADAAINGRRHAINFARAIMKGGGV